MFKFKNIETYRFENINSIELSVDCRNKINF